MKTKMVKILMVSILLLFSVRSNADCFYSWSFTENYSNNFNNDEIFFIKGVALEVYEYGRTIEVIEDLKGNFDGGASIFVWGAGFPSEGSGFIGFETNRDDVITSYQENDTLVMLLGKPIVLEGGIETSNDYATIECAYSVLNLSNGFVTGVIDVDTTTMLWEELQTLLNNITAVQPVYTRNGIYQQNGTIFFENSGDKAVNLLFYDLSGKLVYEAMTTSNSYRPVLAGGAYICKIDMGGEAVTFKYIAP